MIEIFDLLYFAIGVVVGLLFHQVFFRTLLTPHIRYAITLSTFLILLFVVKIYLLQEPGMVDICVGFSLGLVIIDATIVRTGRQK